VRGRGGGLRAGLERLAGKLAHHLGIDRLAGHDGGLGVGGRERTVREGIGVAQVRCLLEVRGEAAAAGGADLYRGPVESVCGGLAIHVVDRAHHIDLRVADRRRPAEGRAQAEGWLRDRVVEGEGARGE
jgi:hypothetical protein